MRPLLLLLALLLSGPAAAADAPWARIDVPGAAVSVELPGVVVPRHVVKQTLIGKVVSDTLLVEPEGGWMAVTVTHVPGVALKVASEDSVLNRARKSVLADTKGEQSSWQAVERGGRSGMELRFTVDKGSAVQQGVSEIHTFDGMVITLTYALPKASVPDGDRFRASLRFD